MESLEVCDCWLGCTGDKLLSMLCQSGLDHWNDPVPVLCEPDGASSLRTSASGENWHDIRSETRVELLDKVNYRIDVPSDERVLIVVTESDA